MRIIGQDMKKNSQVEKLEQTMGTTASSQVPSELRLGAIKQKGGQVFRTADGYIIKGMSGMPTKAFTELLKRDNNGVVKTNYRDDIEANDQISETEEPLWNVEKSNGEFNIKRNF